MDPFTTAILSSAVYDMIKHSISITGASLRDSLQGWIMPKETSEELAAELNRLELNDEMSEAAIDRSLMSSEDVIHLISQIQPKNTTNITQVHYGTGDNVAGNKTIK